MRPGDVVVQLGGEPVADAEALLQRVASKNPGSAVTIKGIRSGQEVSWEVKIGERPTNTSSAPDQSKQ